MPNPEEQQSVVGRENKMPSSSRRQDKRMNKKTHREGGKRKKQQSQEGKPSGDRESGGGERLGLQTRGYEGLVMRESVEVMASVCVLGGGSD